MIYRKLTLLLLASTSGFGQYKYGLKPVTYEGYVQSVKANLQNELINLQQVIPGIMLDIRYATANNFTGEKIYNLPRAYARRPVA
jgi:zinc D-Ala-D-Ala dipeptidase